MRGTNGYTLDDTGQQPQNNVVGTVWWDDIALYEPESMPDELTVRGVKSAAEVAAVAPARPRLEGLDLGERLLGANVLNATIVNPGEREFRPALGVHLTHRPNVGVRERAAGGSRRRSSPRAIAL